jgi:hypothetical protein
MTNLHAFKITYLGATNTRGSRVKVKSLRFDQSKLLSYNYEDRDITETAKKYLESLGFDIIGQAEDKHGMILLSSTFKPLK